VLDWKTRLVRGLYDLGLDRQDILDLFRFIDWLLVLPADLERQFREGLESWEAERRMPYLSSLERDAIEKGLQQGLRQGLEQGLQQGLQQMILDLLEIRFAQVPPAVLRAIRELEDPERLRALHKQAAVAGSLAEFSKNLEGFGAEA
jgi:hypothetical protein